MALWSFLFVLNIQSLAKATFDIRLYYIYIYIYKESYWLYILISITYDYLIDIKRFIFWLRTSNISSFIYMERNKSFKYTPSYFWIRKLQTFQKQFFVLTLTIYCFLLLTKIFYLLQNFLGKESTIKSLYPTSSVGLQG